MPPDCFQLGAARLAANLPYDINGWTGAAYKLESAILVDGANLAQSTDAREKMKRAIVKYGAVTFSYNIRNGGRTI